MLNKKQRSRFKYFLKRYSLDNYEGVRKPTVFFSLWNFRTIREHKGFALIIWRGTDVLKMQRRLKTIKKMKNVKHIAISSYISKDLNKCGIKHKIIPVVGVNLKYFIPCVMGKEIYTYVPNVNPKKYNVRYGMLTIKQIRKKIKYKINITTSCNQYSKKDLSDLYAKCFCGFRLTKHDGLPSQVIEMGLMGRKSIYNGDIPGSISWSENNIDDIVKKINKEAEKIGTIDYTYSQEIEKFVEIGDKWLDTDFWET